jgi:hypothetical protein
MARKHNKKKVKAALQKKTKGKWSVQDTYDKANRLMEQFSRRLDGKKYPPASKVGQYPARRTGNLSRSLKARVKGRTIYIGTGTQAPYAKYLAAKRSSTNPAGGRLSAIDFATQANANLSAAERKAGIKIVGIIQMKNK